MQFITKYELFITHKYKGECYTYSLDIEGYISLKKLSHYETSETIENLEDIDDLSVSDVTKIRLLHILLKNTVDDDFIAMTNQTFEDIVDTIVHYKNWDAFGYLEPLGEIKDE